MYLPEQGVSFYIGMEDSGQFAFKVLRSHEELFRVFLDSNRNAQPVRAWQENKIAELPLFQGSPAIC